MTAKKKSTRHLPPSTEILLSRVDRKLNRLLSVTETMLPHWRRLIDEKEILQGQVETLKGMLRVREANAFIAEPLKPRTANETADIPTLTPELNADPAPSAHVYDGPYCERCKRLKVAIEASDLPCIDSLGDTA